MMKKVIFVFLLISNFCYSQIPITKTIKEKKVIKEYDSTFNFPAKDISLLIGQDLFLKPKSESLRKYGYDKFVYDYKKSSYGKNVYLKMSDGFNSSYEKLAGKVFSLIDVKETDSYEPKLKLVNKSNKDTLYYVYRPRSKHSFPFIVQGFFEKVKNQNINKKYIIRSLINPVESLTEGFVYDKSKKEFWTVKDVTLDDKYFELAYILKNDSGNEILIYKDDLERKSLPEEVVKAIKLKHPLYFNYIINEKVKVGMPKEAVILSWGEPKSKNISSYSEQWVYDGQYLYFKKGRLTSFN